MPRREAGKCLNSGSSRPEFPSPGHECYVEVQVSIQIFEGFGRNHKIREAKARLEQEEGVLDDGFQHVQLEVWNSYQVVRTAGGRVRDSSRLIEIARQSFDAARHRYNHGVGSMVELLNAKTELANSQTQHIQAVADWQAAWLRVSGSLGTLTLSEFD